MKTLWQILGYEIGNICDKNIRDLFQNILEIAAINHKVARES